MACTVCMATAKHLMTGGPCMQIRSGSKSYCVACLIGLAGLLPLSSFPPLIAQQQTVGGTSSFDQNPGLSGNTGRRQLSSPLSVIPEDFAKLKLAPGFLLSMEVYD